jgi:hypothetical protein
LFLGEPPSACFFLLLGTRSHDRVPGNLSEDALYEQDSDE